MLKQVGSGAFSRVFQATHLPTNELYAIKVLSFRELGRLNWPNVQRELELHQEFDTRFIVKLFDFFADADHLYMILEFCPQKNLFQHINTLIKLPQVQVRRVFLEVCSAIQYLHARDIVMRDLKPENILLDSDKSAKLCDFGWAAKLGDTEYLKAKAGTYAYMSPEALMGQPQNLKTDIWALGILLYEIHYNKEPFEADDTTTQLAALRKGLPRSDGGMPQKARDLFERCLQWQAEKRPTIEEVLNHPFFESEDPSKGAGASRARPLAEQINQPRQKSRRTSQENTDADGKLFRSNSIDVAGLAVRFGKSSKPPVDAMPIKRAPEPTIETVPNRRGPEPPIDSSSSRRGPNPIFESPSYRRGPDFPSDSPSKRRSPDPPDIFGYRGRPEVSQNLRETAVFATPRATLTTPAAPATTPRGQPAPSLRGALAPTPRGAPSAAIRSMSTDPAARSVARRFRLDSDELGTGWANFDPPPRPPQVETGRRVEESPLGYRASSIDKGLTRIVLLPSSGPVLPLAVPSSPAPSETKRVRLSHVPEPPLPVVSPSDLSKRVRLSHVPSSPPPIVSVPSNQSPFVGVSSSSSPFSAVPSNLNLSEPLKHVRLSHVHDPSLPVVSPTEPPKRVRLSHISDPPRPSATPERPASFRIPAPLARHSAVPSNTPELAPRPTFQAALYLNNRESLNDAPPLASTPLRPTTPVALYKGGSAQWTQPPQPSRGIFVNFSPGIRNVAHEPPASSTSAQGPQASQGVRMVGPDPRLSNTGTQGVRVVGPDPRLSNTGTQGPRVVGPDPRLSNTGAQGPRVVGADPRLTETGLSLPRLSDVGLRPRARMDEAPPIFTTPVATPRQSLQTSQK